MTAAASRSHFNPRVPCGTRRYRFFAVSGRATFQSTGPVWDPTAHLQEQASDFSISIHGSRVGPDFVMWDFIKHRLYISIHGSRVGPDGAGGRFQSLWRAFQSTGPVWDPTSMYDTAFEATQFQSTGPVWDPTGDTRFQVLKF